MWNRIFAVIRREYLERVRTKAFWISTLLVPVLMGGMMIIPALLAARGGGEATVAVLDLSGRYAEPIQAEVAEMISDGRQLPGAAGHPGPRRRPRGHPGEHQGARPAPGVRRPAGAARRPARGGPGRVRGAQRGRASGC